MTTGRVRSAVLTFSTLVLALAFSLPACAGTSESPASASVASTANPASLDSYVGEYSLEGDSTAVLLLRPDRSFYLFVPEYDPDMSFGGYYTVDGIEVTLTGEGLGPIGSLTASGNRLASQDGRYVFAPTRSAVRYARVTPDRALRARFGLSAAMTQSSPEHLPDCVARA